ncbi:MAG: P pilus assembly chaperone PapD [Colwellia sp.]|jgi:P pilus assembly chaperone PapD
MLKVFHKIIIVTAIFLAQINQTQANLIVAPMRVVFEDRARTETVVLINSSSTAKTYRIQWQQKLALKEGGYHNMTAEEVKNFPIASSMIRMSPKQVTLAAGQRQLVKLSLRRPRNLPDGEYRSHLLFKELPSASKNNKAGIQLGMIMNFTMPVMVRQGDIQQKNAIDNIALTRSKKTGKTEILITLSRQGKKSSIGDISVYFTPQNGGEKVEVARVAHFNFYHELTHVIAKPTWFGGSIGAGKLEVIYKGSKEMSGQVLARKVFDISPNMVKETR